MHFYIRYKAKNKINIIELSRTFMYGGKGELHILHIADVQ